MSKVLVFIIGLLIVGIALMNLAGCTNPRKTTVEKDSIVIEEPTMSISHFGMNLRTIEQDEHYIDSVIQTMDDETYKCIVIHLNDTFNDIYYEKDLYNPKIRNIFKQMVVESYINNRKYYDDIVKIIKESKKLEKIERKPDTIPNKSKPDTLLSKLSNISTSRKQPLYLLYLLINLFLTLQNILRCETRYIHNILLRQKMTNLWGVSNITLYKEKVDYKALYCAYPYIMIVRE